MPVICSGLIYKSGQITGIQMVGFFKIVRLYFYQSPEFYIFLKTTSIPS